MRKQLENPHIFTHIYTQQSYVCFELSEYRIGVKRRAAGKVSRRAVGVYSRAFPRASQVVQLAGISRINLCASPRYLKHVSACVCVCANDTRFVRDGTNAQTIYVRVYKAYSLKNKIDTFELRALCDSSVCGMRNATDR